MPELPDVEAIRSNLSPQVAGRSFTGVILHWAGAVRKPSPAEFQRGLLGKRVEGLGRRGKYLLFRLSQGQTLVLHLGMTGSLEVISQSSPPSSFARALFHLDDGNCLCFIDRRKLGRMWLVQEEEEVVGKLGLEPLEADFTTQALSEVLNKRKTPIKALLLEQEAIAGLGNIYADEVLFKAGIHPLQRAETLSPKEVKSLHQAIKEVLPLAVQRLGALFQSSWSPSSEERGDYELLRIPRSRGQPCTACSTPIERVLIRGRSAYFCPRCQRLAKLKTD